MSNLLDGKAAVVTGGGRGLGLAIARELGTQGARVMIADLSEANLSSGLETLRSEGLDVRGVRTDIADPAAIVAMFDEVIKWAGRVDIAINNAGLSHEAKIVDERLEDWERDLRIMLTGPFLVTQQAGRRMERDGAIVNITSIDAHGADGTYAAYNTAKAGLLSFTKSAAVELAPLGLRINCVSPGFTMTELVAKDMGPERAARMMNEFPRVPMNRMLLPDEIAHAVAFLAGPHASGITGTELIVDGGTLANLYMAESWL
jgi:NAD(P)-dependent dehydrogenase (short-subunit alcohol dehydrogenase family)